METRKNLDMHPDAGSGATEAKIESIGDLGYRNKTATAVDNSCLISSCEQSNLAAAGIYVDVMAAGNSSRIATAGDGNHLRAFGNDSKLAAAGSTNDFATLGDGCVLISAGNYSRIVAAGAKSILFGMYQSTASAGDDGAIALCWYDGKRARIATAYVGENGIKPHTVYSVSNSGEFVEAGL